MPLLSEDIKNKILSVYKLWMVHEAFCEVENQQQQVVKLQTHSSTLQHVILRLSLKRDGPKVYDSHCQQEFHLTGNHGTLFGAELRPLNSLPNGLLLLEGDKGYKTYLDFNKWPSYMKMEFRFKKKGEAKK